MLKYQIGNGAMGEGCAHGMTSSVPLTVLCEVQSLTVGSSAGCGWVPAHRLVSGTTPGPLPTNYCSALFVVVFFPLFKIYFHFLCVGFTCIYVCTRWVPTEPEEGILCPGAGHTCGTDDPVGSGFQGSLEVTGCPAVLVGWFSVGGKICWFCFFMISIYLVIRKKDGRHSFILKSRWFIFNRKSHLYFCPL